MSAERYHPITPIETDGLIRMSDGEWIPAEDVLHYGIDESSEYDVKEVKSDKLKAGAFTAASAALAIFGGITAYRHLKDK